ncbi:MAG: ABC transporter permease, partial [Halothermotrichaceae bacterium]
LSSFFSLKILIMFIYFIFGYIIIASLNAIIGASIKDAQTGGQSTGLIMIIPLVPFYFASAIITNPGGIISRVLSYIPLFTPTTMMLRLGTSTPPVYEILLTFVILLITTYLFVRLSSKIFRIGMLMYGKSADLKEIIKWARSKDY